MLILFFLGEIFRFKRIFKKYLSKNHRIVVLHVALIKSLNEVKEQRLTLTHSRVQSFIARKEWHHSRKQRKGSTCAELAFPFLPLYCLYTISLTTEFTFHIQVMSSSISYSVSLEAPLQKYAEIFLNVLDDSKFSQADDKD